MEPMAQIAHTRIPMNRSEKIRASYVAIASVGEDPRPQLDTGTSTRARCEINRHVLRGRTPCNSTYVAYRSSGPPLAHHIGNLDFGKTMHAFCVCLVLGSAVFS